MLRILNKIRKTGIVTEPFVLSPEIAELGQALKREIHAQFKRSLAIRQVDAGSCNGCELEINALNNPLYDIERFGVRFVASPRHADVLLVTGPVSRHMESALRRTFRATPSPKYVIASGDCACHGGEFGVSYASRGAVENVIPVDFKIAGCPPSPIQLINGLLAMLSSAHTSKVSSQT